MAYVLPPFTRIVNELSKLPGIGPKSAQRLAMYLLRSPQEQVGQLATALGALHETISLCPQCFNLAEFGEECTICRDIHRDPYVLCVVEDALDVMAMERAGEFEGRYHVLGGVISPLEGSYPDDLKIPQLLDRCRAGGVREVILATNTTLEGDATALFVADQLRELGIRVTRIAKGLPMGGDLDYADQSTLVQALLGRREVG
ncbi:MAG TPA: recombination mediator RecR [bacterium]|nr:recombination mediator RecR [bacterium]